MNVRLLKLRLHGLCTKNVSNIAGFDGKSKGVFLLVCWKN